MRDSRLISWAKSGEKVSGDNNSAPMLRIKHWQLKFERLFINFKAFFPFFKTLATVFFQLLVRREKEFTSVGDGFVVLAVVVIIFTTNPGARFIDAAGAIRQQVGTRRVDVQKPAVSIFKYIDIFMRDLPE